MDEPPPPTAALAAFGLRGEATPLRGGQRVAWLVGDLVLKPEVDPQLQAWLGTALAKVPRGGFRLSDPVPAQTGEWVVAGWGASTYQPGRPAGRHCLWWLEVIAAGRAFHEAVAGLDRPVFLDRRADWWARADRQAWGEGVPNVVPELQATATRLLERSAPAGEAQIVHCDLTQNVLLAPDQDPAIIDMSPYWRPPAYAEGVVVADALCWFNAQPSLLDEVDVSVDAVARALLFRLLTTNERLADGVGAADVSDTAARYRSAATAIGL